MKLTKPEKAITVICLLVIGLIIAGLIFIRVSAKQVNQDQHETHTKPIANVDVVPPKVDLNEAVATQSQHETKIEAPIAVQQPTESIVEKTEPVHTEQVFLSICSVNIEVGSKCKTDNSTPWSDLIATMLFVDQNGGYKVSVTQADNPDVGITPEYVELNLGVQQ